MSNDNASEVEAHANKVFARIAGKTRQRRPRKPVRMFRTTPPSKPVAAWLSGIEAALPNGDKD